MKSIYLIYLIILSLLFAACARENQNLTAPGEDELSISELNKNGWANFSAGDYPAAITCFNEVLARDSINAGSRVGKGWTLLMQHSDNFTEIVFHLQKGVVYDQWRRDARCGLAVTRFIQKQYSETEALVDLILEEESDYFFQYQPTIDWHDLLLLKCQACFLTRKYELAWKTVRQITAVFSLDPNDRESWVVGGTSYFSFEAALAEIIELLSEMYRE